MCDYINYRCGRISAYKQVKVITEVVLVYWTNIACAEMLCLSKKCVGVKDQVSTYLEMSVMGMR